MNLNTTNTDLQDLQVILSKIGKVAGYVKIFNVEDNITSDIKNEFSNELKAAKGIWVEFEILPSTSLWEKKHLVYIEMLFLIQSFCLQIKLFTTSSLGMLNTRQSKLAVVIGQSDRVINLGFNIR